MYKSPIETIYEDVQRQYDNYVCKAVKKVGIKVDKDELIKALHYDRDQYLHGYGDGWDAKEASIVRCKDCVYCGTDMDCWVTNRFVTDSDFCSKGEERR